MVKPYKYFSGTDDLNDPFKANKTDTSPNQTANSVTEDESKNNSGMTDNGTSPSEKKDSDEKSEETNNKGNSIEESPDNGTELTKKEQQISPGGQGNKISTCVSMFGRCAL